MTRVIGRVILLLAAGAIVVLSSQLDFPWRLLSGTVGAIVAGRTLLALCQARVRKDARLMEVAAFCVFASEVLSIALDNGRNIFIRDMVHHAPQDFPVWVAKWPIAIVYCVSLLRFFLWEWRFEVDDELNIVLHDAGVLSATTDSTVRLAGWTMLLLFPAALEGRTTYITSWLGMESTPNFAGLMLVWLYGLFFFWDLVGVAVKAYRKSRRFVEWLIYDASSVAVVWLMYWAFGFASRRGFDVLGAMVLEGAAVLAAVVVAVALAFDVTFSRYWELLVERREKRKGSTS